MSVQKRIIPRGRSRSPLNNPRLSNFSQSRFTVDEQILIPKKPIKKIQNLDNDKLIQILKSTHESLTTCFDIFELLYQNFAPQRCIQHNNFITLYCQNQKRLLCVNCLYGNINHRNHKVIPIKNALQKVKLDNKELNQRLLQCVQDLKKIEKQALENIYKSEEGVQGILITLDDQYERIKNIINQKYTFTRNQILQNFSEIEMKNDIIIQQISWLKSTYIQRESLLPKDEQQASSLFKHLTLNLMIDSQKIEGEMFKQVNVEQFRQTFITQFTKIRQILDAQKDKKVRF